MQKLNALGVELQSLKRELLNPNYPSVVKKSMITLAHTMVEKELIDVNLHLLLTDEKTGFDDFNAFLHETPSCLKTKEELLAEYEKIRESLEDILKEMEPDTSLTSKSLVDTEQISFAQTIKLDKQWVSDYFGQPADEIDKMMVRKGFVEKFAVLRLAKILSDFLKSGLFDKRDGVDVKATRAFYDVDHGYYGIHLMFYISIEDAEDEKKAKEHLEYIQDVAKKVREYAGERLKV